MARNSKLRRSCGRRRRSPPARSGSNTSTPARCSECAKYVSSADGSSSPSSESHAVAKPRPASLRQHSASVTVLPNPPGACSRVSRLWVGKHRLVSAARSRKPVTRPGTATRCSNSHARESPLVVLEASLLEASIAAPANAALSSPRSPLHIHQSPAATRPAVQRTTRSAGLSQHGRLPRAVAPLASNVPNPRTPSVSGRRSTFRKRYMICSPSVHIEPCPTQSEPEVSVSGIIGR